MSQAAEIIPPATSLRNLKSRAMALRERNDINLNLLRLISDLIEELEAVDQMARQSYSVTHAR